MLQSEAYNQLRHDHSHDPALKVQILPLPCMLSSTGPDTDCRLLALQAYACCCVPRCNRVDQGPANDRALQSDMESDLLPCQAADTTPTPVTQVLLEADQKAGRFVVEITEHKDNLAEDPTQVLRLSLA